MLYEKIAAIQQGNRIMATQVMFGKNGASAPVQAQQATIPVRPVPAPNVSQEEKNPYAGMDNLNEVDFGRTFAMPYAQDKSMLVVFILWLVGAGGGSHRFYLGDKGIGVAMAALGVFNIVLWATGGFTAYLSYKAGNGMLSGGLISAIVVAVLHVSWVFFDFFYILVRKFTSK